MLLAENTKGVKLLLWLVGCLEDSGKCVCTQTRSFINLYKCKGPLHEPKNNLVLINQSFNPVRYCPISLICDKYKGQYHYIRLLAEINMGLHRGLADQYNLACTDFFP